MTDRAFTVELPMPPSIWRLYEGRGLNQRKTKHYQAWANEAGWVVRAGRGSFKNVADDVQVSIRFQRRGDIRHGRWFSCIRCAVRADCEGSMTTYAMDISLTTVPGQELVGKTHLGQAHLAGTGPEGKSCRMCSHWYNIRDDEPHHEYRSNAEGMMCLQASRCRYPIMNKALRRVPLCACLPFFQ